MQTYTEESYENSVIELFQNMGYTHIYGPDVETRNFNSPLYDGVLQDCIFRLNSDKPKVAIEEALFKLKNFDNGELIQQNNIFMDYLQNGIGSGTSFSFALRIKILPLFDNYKINYGFLNYGKRI